MSKFSLAAVIATLFLLLGPYFGFHLFGQPESRFMESSQDSNNYPVLDSNDLSSDGPPAPNMNLDPRYLDSGQDDLMEQVPADELSIE